MLLKFKEGILGAGRNQPFLRYFPFLLDSICFVVNNPSHNIPEKQDIMAYDQLARANNQAPFLFQLSSLSLFNFLMIFKPFLR